MSKLQTRILSAIAALLLVAAALPGCSDSDECPTCPEGGSGGANLTMDVFHPDPDPFMYLDVWAAGPNDVFVSAGSGVVFRYKDGEWTRYNTGTLHALRGIWGWSADNVFAVGDIGDIVHFDGSSWNPMYSGVLYSFNCVWGHAPDTVYAAGDHGTTVKYDGTGWTEYNSGISSNTGHIYDVWGSSGNDIWFAGEDWSSSPSGRLINHVSDSIDTLTFPNPMLSVWGWNDDDLMAGDRQGNVWHYDGADWADSTVSDGNEIRAIWGSSHDDVWAGNNTYFDQSRGHLNRWDGRLWGQWRGVELDQGVGAIHGVAADEVYAIGGGAQLTRFDGSQWETLNNERITADDLSAIWGFSTDNFWTFGRQGQIFHYDGTGWSDTSVAGVMDRINGAWGSAPNDVYAVGGSGTILHFDGNSWSSENHGLTTAYLESVWGTASSDVWVGGPQGQMLYLDSGQWILRDTWPASYGPARSLWGSAPDDYYAVVYNGVLHYNGSEWSVVPLGGRNVFAVHGASDTEVYFLAGGGGIGPADASKQADPKKAGRTPTGTALLRFDGTNLVEVARDIQAELSRIWALGPNNVFMSGSQYSRPAIAHYNGTGVSVTTTDTQSGCYALWCTESNTAFATGYLGAVYRATAR